MYHIGIVNSDKNANYKRDLGLLANYTIPSIMEKPMITIPTTVETLGDFTYHKIEGTALKQDMVKDSGSIRVYETEGLAHLLLVDPIKKDISRNEVLSMALVNHVFPKQDEKVGKVNVYTVWHNNTPGILLDVQYPSRKAMEISYITRNDKNLFIQTIIANQHKKDISRDDIINLLTDVKMNGETLDSTSVISPLSEYDF